MRAGCPPDPLLEVLREAGHEVRLVEITSVRVGDTVMVSTTAGDELIGAECYDGPDAAEVERVLSLIG